MIVLHPSQDFFHTLPQHGAYEWSYFDGLSDCGRWGFVAIWFRGAPMSPYYASAVAGSGHASSEDHCAFTFSLYRDGKRVHYMFSEQAGEMFSCAESMPDVGLGNNSVRFVPGGVESAGTYGLDINTALPGRRSRLSGTIVVRAVPTSPVPTPNTPTTDPRHFWVPSAPDCTFTAELDLHRVIGTREHAVFSGRAYHDRNFGTEPLQNTDCDWRWGRLHSGDRTFVFFDIVPRSQARDPNASWMVLYDASGPTSHLHQAAFDYRRRRLHWSTLPYDVLVTGTSRDEHAVSFSARTTRLLDSGPFYHRALAEIVVQRQGNVVMQGVGMTEYLRPSRLRVGFFRPFIKFRVHKV